ncbi:hypothetical protein CEXT_260031 [Caerostris extrusa]|uniref:Uncharacterized protein n=1 Tax=Caerostris extrusa TaxID=172846 RepID=A0AAV4U2E6_CAEEX|nr:hypothetical protein CEXT_260031 [Caerostris extrusa]
MSLKNQLLSSKSKMRKGICFPGKLTAISDPQKLEPIVSSIDRNHIYYQWECGGSSKTAFPRCPQKQKHKRKTEKTANPQTLGRSELFPCAPVSQYNYIPVVPSRAKNAKAVQISPPEKCAEVGGKGQAANKGESAGAAESRGNHTEQPRQPLYQRLITCSLYGLGARDAVAISKALFLHAFLNTVVRASN